MLSRDCTTAVTNYEYEAEIEDEKRNIFLLEPRYLNVIRNDLDAAMPYKKGSTQYVSCLLYTSPSPRDRTRSRMPSSA